jgi:hypothetical protein
MTTRLSATGGAVVVTLSAASALLVASHAPAGAARVRHYNPRYPVVRPNPPITQDYVEPGGIRVYRDDSVPGGFRTDHDPLPSPNDPSRWGGGAP